MIGAAAPGFTSDTKLAKVTAMLGFSPGTVSIIIPTTRSVALNLSGPAPMGGLRIDLASDNTKVAMVPANLIFPAGATSVSVPVTGLGIGSTVIRAPRPYLTSPR